MPKIRIDQLMVQQGLVESRTMAQKLVMSGTVRADGEVVAKQSDLVSIDAEITIDTPLEFVSRGGIKLKAAIEAFDIIVEGLICADVGASTGGFTDCLLQNGATRVYAIDVGYGVLHWKLRNDPRIAVMERTNARYLNVLPEPVQLVTIDASFISLDYLLPVIRNWFGQFPGRVIALIKPQFEAGREQARIHGGVIKDHSVHLEVLNKVIGDAERVGFDLNNLTVSPIKGPKGNIEFLAFFCTDTSIGTEQRETLISRVMSEISAQ
jgi:23S rRNA (cytidine1920-2'-O)/16S rRNA (cytidine1409-2'-O)-methyltransferase